MQEKYHRLYSKYPPSSPCSCDVCTSYCSRPGWWLVHEARWAIEAGLANRMMLEFSQDFSLGVLSPAFKGNEGYYALQMYASEGCTFLNDGLCEIMDTIYRPIECRFCHHERLGRGIQCHRDIEHDWNCSKGRRLVRQWLLLEGLQPPLLYHPPF